MKFCFSDVVISLAKKVDLKQSTFLTAFYFGLHQEMNDFWEYNACALWEVDNEIERYSEEINLT